MAFSIFLIILNIVIVTSFNYLKYNPNEEIDRNYPKPPLEGQLKADLEYYYKVNNDSILTACLVLTRNNLVANNPDVSDAMEKTTHDKSKVFDKIIVSMVKNCIRGIDLEIADQTLSADNITQSVSNYDHFLKFDQKDIEGEPTFDNHERELLDAIFNIKPKQTNVSKKNKTSKVFELPKETFVDGLISQLDRSHTRLMVIGMLISFITSFLLWQIYNYCSGSNRKVNSNVSSAYSTPHKKKRE